MGFQVIMQPLPAALVIFFCLLVASLGSVFLYHKMQPLRHQEETNNLLWNAELMKRLPNVFKGLRSHCATGATLG